MIIHPQILAKNNKPEFVVLPYKEYEKILRSLEEIEDIREIKEFHANKTPTIPLEILQQIANGTHPVRAFREWRGLSSVKLATEAGITRQYLHQIEHGQRKGNARTLTKIADILGIDVELLIVD